MAKTKQIEALDSIDAMFRAFSDRTRLIKEKKTVGPHAVARAEHDGSLTIWPSQKDAAKALGITGGALRDKILDGALLDAGHSSTGAGLTV